MSPYFACSILVASLLDARAAFLTVNTTAGQLRGFAINNTRLFIGIPYAEPPLGKNRWREPKPKSPWPGIRYATGYGASCMQDGKFDPTIPDINEDCLFLVSFLSLRLCKSMTLLTGRTFTPLQQQLQGATFLSFFGFTVARLLLAQAMSSEPTALMQLSCGRTLLLSRSIIV
jgi:hypothetical protein